MVRVPPEHPDAPPAYPFGDGVRVVNAWLCPITCPHNPAESEEREAVLRTVVGMFRAGQNEAAEQYYQKHKATLARFPSLATEET